MVGFFEDLVDTAAWSRAPASRWGSFRQMRSQSAEKGIVVWEFGQARLLW